MCVCVGVGVWVFCFFRKTSRAALQLLRGFLSPLYLLCSCFRGSHCVCGCVCVCVRARACHPPTQTQADPHAHARCWTAHCTETCTAGPIAYLPMRPHAHPSACPAYRPVWLLASVRAQGGRGPLVHTRLLRGTRDKGGGAQQGRRGNLNSGNREPEWSGWESVRMGGSDNKGGGLASQPRRYQVPGQPLLNRHQVGGVSRSLDGLFTQQEREPIRGRPAGKRTFRGRPGQRVEEQGTWASRTQKHSDAGYGRPVDRGVWTAKTVKRTRQQPTHPQYANYWAPLTRKRHTMPHSAQPQHTKYWAPQTRKRHQQEHRPTESSDPTQHTKGRTGPNPNQGPIKEQQPDGMSHTGV